jgi:hypothetical protein
MKAKKASEAATLEQIPNVGKAVAQDLRNIGINRPDRKKTSRMSSIQFENYT